MTRPFAETAVFTVWPHAGSPEQTVNRANFLHAKGPLNQPEGQPTCAVPEDRPKYLSSDSDTEEEEWYFQPVFVPVRVAPIQPAAPNHLPLSLLIMNDTCILSCPTSNEDIAAKNKNKQQPGVGVTVCYFGIFVLFRDWLPVLTQQRFSFLFTKL